MTKTAWLRRSRVLVPALALAVGASCSNEIAGSSAAPAVARHSWMDGQSLFRQLVFGEGEVAKLLPELYEGMEPPPEASELTDEQRQGIETVKRQLLREVVERDPEFMDGFARDIQSGDPLRVTEALDRTGELLTAILAEAEKESPVAPDPEIAEGRVIFVVVFVLVAVAAVVAGVVNVTAAAQVNSAVHINVMYTRTKYWSTLTAEQSGQFSQLRRDEVAKLIADRLAA